MDTAAAAEEFVARTYGRDSGPAFSGPPANT